MPYRRPTVTHKQFRETLAESYGVEFVPRLTDLGTSQFKTMWVRRKLGDRELESMYPVLDDDAPMDWWHIDNVCGILKIDYSEDRLWGVEI